MTTASNSRVLRTIPLMLIVVLFCPFTYGKVIYVDDDATGANDGTSWVDACVYLQDALADANDSDKPVEIRVAEGVHEPDQGANQTPGDREATFQLINGVSLNGGFAGSGEPDPNARDISAYATILSGDLNGDDVEVSDPFNLLNEPTREDNSYHVVSSHNAEQNAILDGFIITAGNANSDHKFFYHGGGVFNRGDYDEDWGCIYGGPTIVNCKIKSNYSKGEGGGIFNGAICEPHIINCDFIENMSLWGGGGIKNDTSNPIIESCKFKCNYAGDAGAIDNEESSPKVIKCVFMENSSDGRGGAIENWMGGCSPIFINCLFYNNSAEYGGVMCTSNNFQIEEGSKPELINCTLVQNSAAYGNALACTEGFFEVIPSDFHLTNCIFWNGGNEIWNSDGSTIEFSHSNIQGGFPGEGNIDVDPLFADPGYWDPNGTPADANDDYWVDGDYHLTPCSPCIDSGDPNYISEPNETDFDGNSRVIGGRIDMGAYEYPFVYDKPGEGSPPGSWWKYSENPVFYAGGPGEWDNRLKACAVLKDSNEPVTKYKMWYVGGETPFFEGAGIGYATSTDGINWVRSENNPVLEPGESWNVSGFSGICVIKDGPIYKLWYEGIDDESTARIGYATSSDGINWDINNSNPVFSPGGNDAWDNEDVGNPCVVKEGSIYKMWYWGDNDLTGIDQIGLAVSNDGINWQRIRSEPVIAPDPSIWWQDGEGIGTPHVLRFNSGYVMAYHAADQSGTIRIGLATSSDGLEWKKEHNPILDIGTDNSWDSISVVTGSLIQDASHLKLWYLGIDASEIIKAGLAISCDDIVFDIEGNN